MLPRRITGSYELQAEFARVQGNDSITFSLPVGPSRVQLNLSGYFGQHHGLQLIDGKAFNMKVALHPYPGVALLPDRWIVAHPEPRLEQREEESREAQLRRRRKRATRRTAAQQPLAIL